MFDELHVVIRLGDAFDRIHHVTASVTTIGRNQDCDIRLAAGEVSRVHAIITWQNKACRIRDENSMNGTRLGGELIRNEIDLPPGIEIRIGRFHLTAYANLADAMVAAAQEDSTRREGVEWKVQDAEQMLTRAQRKVYDLLLDGDSEKEIARRLNVSTHTVHTHTCAIYSRFRVSSRAELLAKCRARKSDAGAS